MGVAYCALYLFASLCLATGMFHPESSHIAHHTHTDHESHHHTDQHGQRTMFPPDVCDFILCVMTTTVWHSTSVPSVSLFRGRLVSPAMQATPGVQVAEWRCIRAPPRVSRESAQVI